MKSNVDTCPACGKPMDDPDHIRVLLVPAIVFNAIVGYFVREWRHSGNANPSLN